MAAWGTKQKVAGAPSRGQTDSSTARWQPGRQRRPAVSPEEVARRAYEKWVARGGRHGDDQRDWFEAERELWRETGRGAN